MPHTEYLVRAAITAVSTDPFVKRHGCRFTQTRRMTDRVSEYFIDRQQHLVCLATAKSR